MNQFQKRRLLYVTLFLLGLATAASLIFFALKQNLNAFVTPTQIAVHAPGTGYQLRLGGMVKKGSVRHDTQSLQVDFVVTDFKHDIPVRYTGVLPDLFHEEKGVLAEGKINEQGIFIASRVLAKHDENYMPKNVYDAIRKESLSSSQEK